jgi:hypothetical protein
MAQSRCKKCGDELAEQVESCPRCGAAIPGRRPLTPIEAKSRAKKIGEGSLVVGGAIIIIGVLVSRFGPALVGMSLEGVGLAVIGVGALVGRVKR